MEGDGLAWLTQWRPSSDPTPEHPMGLALAARDPGPDPVLYLARPCQYVGAGEPPCARELWTHGRFSDAVVESLGHAIDHVLRDLPLARVTLVGYSGGGVAAALVAARRRDVVRLVTVGAPLDHGHWTRETSASPLLTSRSPVEFAAALAAVPQVHFVGARDTRVPRGAVDAYVRALPDARRVHVVSLPGFDHGCCWAEEWPRLLARAEALTPIPRTATPTRP